MALKKVCVCVCVFYTRHHSLDPIGVGRNWSSSVGIATGYGLDGEGSEFEARYVQECSLFHIIQTGSTAHQTTYRMGTGGSFPGGKAIEA
jgi:hypothetical protein